MNVPDNACGVVKLISGNENLLGKRVNILERSELALICFVVGDTVGNLNIVFLIALLCKEINLAPAAVVDMKLVSHIQQFVVDDIFKVVVEVKPIVRAAD